MSLAILTKPVFYAFCLIVPIIALLFYTKGIYKLQNVWISLIPLLTVASISTINYSKTGYFHYSSVNEKFISEYGAYLAVGDKGNVNAQQKIDSLLSEAKRQPDFKSYCKYINKVKGINTSTSQNPIIHLQHIEGRGKQEEIEKKAKDTCCQIS